MEKKSVDKTGCESKEIACAKTVTSAFAPNGDLWRIWAFDKDLYYQISIDNGTTFMSRQRIGIPEEKISARNENRPKMAFDQFNGNSEGSFFKRKLTR
jgi:hypothetical protein